MKSERLKRTWDLWGNNQPIVFTQEQKIPEVILSEWLNFCPEMFHCLDRPISSSFFFFFNPSKDHCIDYGVRDEVG